MFEALLEKILKKFFGDYVENLDQENLNVGVIHFVYPRFGLVTLNLKTSVSKNQY